MYSLMHDFMTYIGGQSKIKCSYHKLPLITNNQKNVKCYHMLHESELICGRNIALKYPDLRYQCGL